MECLIGIKGKDFVLVASDNMAAHSIIAIKHDAQKQFELSDKMVRHNSCCKVTSKLISNNVDKS